MCGLREKIQSDGQLDISDKNFDLLRRKNFKHGKSTLSVAQIFKKIKFSMLIECISQVFFYPAIRRTSAMEEYLRQEECNYSGSQAYEGHLESSTPC